MDYNEYQPVYEQTQEPQQYVPEYQKPSQLNDIPQDIQQKTEGFFGQALASTIMSVFPVASIIALIKGKAILPEIIALITSCTSLGISVPGKLKTAKILATIGKFAGLGFTIYYGVCAAFLALYFTFAMFVSFIGIIGNLF